MEKIDPYGRTFVNGLTSDTAGTFIHLNARLLEKLVPGSITHTEVVKGYCQMVTFSAIGCETPVCLVNYYGPRDPKLHSSMLDRPGQSDPGQPLSHSRWGHELALRLRSA